MDRKASGLNLESTPLLHRKSIRLSGDACLEEEEEEVVGHAHSISLAFSLVVTMIGGGAMSLPYTLAQGGWLAASIALLISALVTLASLCCLVVSQRGSGAASYEELAVTRLGPWGARLTQVSVLLVIYGVLCQFVIISTDLLCPFVADFLSQFSTRLIIVVVMTLLSLPRSMHALRFTSFVAFILLLYVLFVVVLRCFYPAGIPAYLLVTPPTEAITTDNFPAIKTGTGLAFALPVQLMAYGCHVNSVRCVHELPNGRKDNIFSILYLSLGVTFLFYLLLSAAGYYLFHGQPSDDLLNDFPKADELGNFARLGISAVLVLKTPLMFQPIRSLLEYLVFGKATDTSAPIGVAHVCETIILGTLMFVGATLVPHLGVVMDLLGSTCGVMIAYILPAAIYINSSRSPAVPPITALYSGVQTRSSRSSGSAEFSSSSELKDQSSSSFETRPDDRIQAERPPRCWLGAMLLASFGCFIGITGLVGLVLKDL